MTTTTTTTQPKTCRVTYSAAQQHIFSSVALLKGVFPEKTFNQQITTLIYYKYTQTLSHTHTHTHTHTHV